MIATIASYITVLALLASLGAATMAGLLFIFSNTVMRALAQLPPATGMEAMQRINVAIVNPPFLIVFVGTPLLYLLLAVSAFHSSVIAGRWWLVVGAICYLGGVLGVTMLANIPLNNALAKQGPAAATHAWPAYVAVWTLWNHVRTTFAFASTVTTVVGALAAR